MIEQMKIRANVKNTKIRIDLKNTYLPDPTMTPEEARNTDVSYDTTVYADVHVQLVAPDFSILAQTILYKVELFKLPVMVGCCLSSKQTSQQYNDAGYFIVKGTERAIVSQERINYNHVYIYKQRMKYKFIAEIRSVKDSADYSVLFQAKLQIDDTIVFSIPYIQHDIPMHVLFTVLRIPLDFILLYTQHNPFLHKFISKQLDSSEELSFEECIEYISQFASNKLGDRKVAYVKHVLEHEILPHFNSFVDIRVKAVFIIQMLNKLVSTAYNHRTEDDRDHICNKRIETAGELIANLTYALLKKSFKTIEQAIEKKEVITRIEDLGLPTLFHRHGRNGITQRIYYCFSTGNWGIQQSNYIRQGVSQVLSRLSYVGTLSHLQRIAVPIGKESRNTQVRQIHCSNYGFIDPVETPEGQTVGIIKNFSILTRISLGHSTTYILDLIHLLFPKLSRTYKIFLDYVCIYLNGLWIGSIKKAKVAWFISQFRIHRMNRIIPFCVSIGWNESDSEITIYSDSGRALRPVIVASKLGHIHLQEDLTWDEYLQQGFIVYIDGNEAESSVIAMRFEDNSEQHDYVEIHPSLMLGICSNLIPFPEHSQAPRNVYVSAMMKQAIGMYHLDYQKRFDTFANVLNYPQRKLVSTRFGEICHMEDMPSGQEAIVAVMCYSGFNQEDSILMNKSSIERGLFGSTAYRTVSTCESKRGGNHEIEVIQLPSSAIQNISYNYSLLDSSGIVRKGTIVKKHDVLVGKVILNRNQEVADCSLICKSGVEEGYVDEILVTTNGQGYQLVKIRICSLCTPEIGDKFCQISAQKGTIGMVYSQEDMPFTGEGITPDIIINPHAFPSRMTINMLLEIISGKVVCFTGNIQDASAFEHDGEQLVSEMGTQLLNNGYEARGTEIMYNGFTGEPLSANIFIGPAYYQRLKHLVANKIHGRNYGNVQLLSRQPCAGRSREGGLRYGEMERDCAIVHGISSFLKERLFDLSDPYALDVCARCNSVATAKNKCKSCSSDQTTLVAIPYACKLMFQELEAMAIKIHITPDD
jgi:DNA-directed RNA polymerase II subunit RPB2